MDATGRTRQIAQHMKLSVSKTSRAFPTVSATVSPGVLVETIEVSPGANVATVTVSNPSKLNIVDSRLVKELTDAFKRLSADSTLRVIVLTGGPAAPGKSPSFIGGADIREMSGFSTSEDGRAFIMAVHQANTAIRESPVPVIARVHGFSLGGGFEIMVSCDLRIATKTSTFGMPEVRVGLPSVIEAAFLPGLIGMGRARRMLYLGENIDGLTAERWGLIERVVEDENALDDAVSEWVRMIISMGPQTIRSQKRLMQKWENMGIDQSILAGVEAYAEAFADGGKEPKEYMATFLNRER